MKYVSLLVGLVLVTPAIARPIVVLDIQLDGAGNFTITADASGTTPFGGDANGGIAWFNLLLDSYTTAQNMSPRYVDVDAGVLKGFSIGENTWIGPLDELFSAQSLANPGTLLYDVGIVPGDAPGAAVPRGVPWDVPCVLATGVGEPDYLACQQLGSYVAVWRHQGLETTWDANVIWTPEPATLALLALGGLSLLRRRRGN